MIGKHLRKYAKDTIPKYDRYIRSNVADFTINHILKENFKDAVQGKTHPNTV